jgi:hypothetical protein
MNASLPGFEPPPDQPARFAVMGLLRDQAKVYPQPNGSVLLQVVINQHLAAHPEARCVLATYRYPALGCPAATVQSAKSKAAQLPAGTEVVAVGSALYPGEYLGEPFMVLADVAGITLQSPASAQHRAGLCTQQE